jgi:N-acetylneuraminic acid mutarotase
MYANAYFYVIGGFDGQKVNDMYRVKVCPVIAEPQIQAIKEEVKVQEEPPKENTKWLTQEYFDSIPSYKWQKVQGTGKKYTPRTGHECLFYKDKIYLFGGMDDDDRRNDLFSFDIFTNHWDKMIAQGDVPSPRSGARGVAYNDFLYFFGGYSKQSAEYYEDLFRYDMNRRRWEALPDNGEKPSKRTDHSMVLYGNSFFVFGGYDG